MGKEIIYYLKEYEKEYPLLLDNYFLEYKEVEEIDFINSEIENYNLYLKIVKLREELVFDWFFNVFQCSEKEIGYSNEIINFLRENEGLYWKFRDYFILKDTSITNDLLNNRNSRSETKNKIHQSRLSFAKIISFLETKKSELETQIPKTIPETEPLDLSNTSAVEKIIYLNELGIIDFLKTKPEFIGSTNLMATFLSAITDEKATTLQTSLNKLINNDTDDKNHPYKTKGTVNKIRQTFIDKNIKPKTS